ncbi:hypothetical protein RFI_20176 [Reticulomyxa filosa]|uniref:PH domain-containing protein n=1 Tax=Reticulomyxa filosa TaxID=46433 RepID=X6MTH1_RETFI|nr:hypothetical protein RFI_20176 [Reticulomyxa filosa]|eukprot:ETO17154.1 hypothetical protein RFI_20176 [Reticulomyxa filosa]
MTTSSQHLVDIKAEQSRNFDGYRSMTSAKGFVVMVRPALAGWLEKKSRTIKKWRRRYTTLNDNMLYTHESDSCDKEPTEMINLHECCCVERINAALNTTSGVSSKEENREFVFRIHTCSNNKGEIATTLTSKMNGTKVLSSESTFKENEDMVLYCDHNAHTLSYDFASSDEQELSKWLSHIKRVMVQHLAYQLQKEVVMKYKKCQKLFELLGTIDPENQQVVFFCTILFAFTYQHDLEKTFQEKVTPNYYTEIKEKSCRYLDSKSARQIFIDSHGSGNDEEEKAVSEGRDVVQKMCNPSSPDYDTALSQDIGTPYSSVSTTQPLVPPLSQPLSPSQPRPPPVPTKPLPPSHHRQMSHPFSNSDISLNSIKQTALHNDEQIRIATQQAEYIDKVINKSNVSPTSPTSSIFSPSSSAKPVQPPPPPTKTARKAPPPPRKTKPLETKKHITCFPVLSAKFNLNSAKKSLLQTNKTKKFYGLQTFRLKKKIILAFQKKKCQVFVRKILCWF